MMTQSNLGDCWRNWNWFHQIRPQSQQLLNRQQSYWSESVTISSVWRIIYHSLWNGCYYSLLLFLIYLFIIALRYIQPYILLPAFYLKFVPKGAPVLLCSSALFYFFLLFSLFLALVKSCSHEGVLVSLCWAVPFFFFRETGDYRITANCQLLEITTKNILSISALLWCIVQSTRQHFLKVAISLLYVPMTTFHSQRKQFVCINTGALEVVTVHGVSPTPLHSIHSPCLLQRP